MTIMDPLCDMYTRIRNGIKEKHETVTIPYSNTKLAILNILNEEGFVNTIKVHEIRSNIKSIVIELKYTKDGESIINTIDAVSKVSKRKYVRKSKIEKVQNGFGINIISTSKGIMTGRNARINGIGGQLLVRVT
ncbi:30S ribosomal protein S8 [Candidatus Marinamargulisbacteria bacterium SCGC AG-410-N11]|nr:30S ribosomal protein S8 [Candidatus Marinamargulisbacteria bacterium SCGC AG-410-N11]